MSSFSLKGGIGSASRVVAVRPDQSHTVGALVLSNFGRLPLLTVAGRPFGQRLMQTRATEAQVQTAEKGSIILLLATDAPLDARQLRRLSLRAAAGLARTGSVFGHGSGDISLAFSTAYTVPHEAGRAMPTLPMLHETCLDGLFEAAAQACEQAIIAALWYAETVSGRAGHQRCAVTELVPDWRQWLSNSAF